jgi:hypothetical protein
MEEPGNLEFATKNVVGNPNGGNRFLGTTAEFEYGVKGWWTSELYLDGQATGTQSALFTGYRWENLGGHCKSGHRGSPQNRP